MLTTSAYGRLGRDPEVRTTRNGNDMTTASLAVDVTPYNHDGETTERTGDLLLEQQKANLGQAGQSIRLTWDDDAHLFIGKQIGGDTPQDRAARNRRERGAILAAIRAVIDVGEYIPAATSGRRTAYHVLAARPEFDTERMPDTAAGRRRFWRQIEVLRSIGEVREGSIRRSNRHETIPRRLSVNKNCAGIADTGAPSHPMRNTTMNDDNATALAAIAAALHRLGNADACTPMGALEAHGVVVLEAADKIAVALHDVAEAIRETEDRT